MGRDDERQPASFDRLLVQGALQGEQREQGVQGSLLAEEIIIIKVTTKKGFQIWKPFLIYNILWIIVGTKKAPVSGAFFYYFILIYYCISLMRLQEFLLIESDLLF